MKLCIKTGEQKAHVKEMLEGYSVWFDEDGDGLHIDDWVSFDDMAAVVDYLRQPSDTDRKLFEQCWKDYSRKGSKKVAYERWKKLSEADRKSIAHHIRFYVKSNERKYLKDFERYLSTRTFESVVTDSNTGQILYDPERAGGGAEYSPQCGGALSYNEFFKCYVYVGEFTGRVFDGYTDDDRPSGARIMLNNGRGFVFWNPEQKIWQKEQ